MDYYRTLGVAKDATAAEIKKKYRSLANQHHPDKNGGDETMFKKIGEAYDILGDANKRAEYDRFPNGNPFGGGRPHSQEWGGFNFDDFFDGVRQQPQRNPDSMANVQIRLIQAYTGDELELSLSSGPIKLKIPPGTRPGTRLRVAGKGSTTHRHLPPGDLYIVVNIAMPNNWGWHGDDLFYQTKIDAISAMIGATAEVEHISGKKYKVEIPAGTQHGDRVRLRGLGMPNPVNTVLGNLYIITDIYVPEVSNEEDRQALSNIRGNLVDGK